MSLKEFEKLSDADLKLKAEELRRSLYDLRVRGVTDKEKDSSLPKKRKKDIARILTLQRQRELAVSRGKTGPA